MRPHAGPGSLPWPGRSGASAQGKARTWRSHPRPTPPAPCTKTSGSRFTTLPRAGPVPRPLRLPLPAPEQGRDEGVRALLLPDGGRRAMPGVADGLVRQGDQDTPDGLHERRVVAPGDVGPPDAAGKQRIPREHEPPAQEAHPPGAVARGVMDLQDEASHGDPVSLAEPPVRDGGRRHLDPEHHPGPRRPASTAWTWSKCPWVFTTATTRTPTLRTAARMRSGSSPGSMTTASPASPSP